MIELDAVVYSGIFVGSALFLLWLISLRLHDVSIVDIWWAPGFAVIAWTASDTPLEAGVRYGGILFLLTIWGLRLGIYLWIRNHGKPEDRRYQAFRAATPGFPLKSLFTVFWLQGGLQILIGIQIFAIARSTAPFNWVDLLGLMIGFAGVLVEAIADRQLSVFKRDPENSDKVMDRGLWAWTRHPNYFGNAVLWGGVAVVGLSAGAPIWTLLGPGLMWFLLLRVSGVTMLESTIVERRPDYRRYIETVPSFIPRPPRR